MIEKKSLNFIYLNRFVAKMSVPSVCCLMQARGVFRNAETDENHFKFKLELIPEIEKREQF